MKLNLKLILTLFCMIAAISIVAQSQKKDGAGEGQSKEGKAKPKPKPIPVYLGQSNYSSGSIDKKTFDSLFRQGLTSRDSAGRIFKVKEFSFTYGERNLYEDSVGKPMIVTDYLAEYCFGDTVNSFLKVNIPERSKPGDTVYFDQILVTAPEGYTAHGKSVKLVIVK